MTRNRNNSACCGGGGLLKATEPDLSLGIAASRVKEAIHTGATDIVSSCVACRLQMSEAVRANNVKLGVYDISEFVAQFL
jgi:Fe-S oxidoreductase